MILRYIWAANNQFYEVVSATYQNCSYKCLSCDNTVTCTNCSSNRIGAPQCKCPTGYKDDGQNSTCLICTT